MQPLEPLHYLALSGRGGEAPRAAVPPLGWSCKCREAQSTRFPRLQAPPPQFPLAVIPDPTPKPTSCPVGGLPYSSPNIYEI